MQGTQGTIAAHLGGAPSGVGDDTDVAEPGEGKVRTPLEKAVDAAFAYHPYRAPNVAVYDEWVVGPTFVVKGEYDMLPVISPAPWNPDPLLYLKMTGILSGAAEATVEVTVAEKGHPKKPEVVIDKYGAEKPKTETKCTCRAISDDTGEPVAELGFPLVRLLKKVGVTRLVFNPETYAVYGYDGEELLGVFAAKRFDRCTPQ